MTATASKLALFSLRKYKAPNSAATPKHACMALNLADHWDNLYELMRFADRWRGQIPNLTQARVSCHGEWYGKQLLEDCTAHIPCMTQLGHRKVAPVPVDVASRFHHYSKAMIGMDAEVILTPAPTFVLSTFQFAVGDPELRELGWIVETNPVTFEHLRMLVEAP